MFWAIVILITAVILFVFATIVFCENTSKSKGTETFLFILGICVEAIGCNALYYSGTGNVCIPHIMPNQIYAVSGQVAVSNGTVAVIEDSKQNPYMVWVKQTDDKHDADLPNLPANTKFVKIGISESGKICLVPADTPPNEK